ncbi:uncharacterized protein LOC113147348 [Cyclospora cayetanensis]|uniref:Uncharacterized protein LOC113147348 n=1 Tax=Cyclospora cayetanensis TaxID=88456 RepID=A0A6P6RZU9_9EIME|nr:uncharacterized protein LOC113147348 [Cyclospora cayetanensis]
MPQDHHNCAPCRPVPPEQAQRQCLCCRQASAADTELVCELLRQSSSQAVRSRLAIVPCFEAFGLSVPPEEELRAYVEDLLNSTYLCQICEDEEGTPLAFMALGHSPFVSTPFYSTPELPSTLADNPAVQELCGTQCNKWFTNWPQWLRDRFSCNRRQAAVRIQHHLAPGSQASETFDSDSDNTESELSREGSSQATSPLPLSFSDSGEAGIDATASAVTRLSDGSCIVPTNTLWLLIFACRPKPDSGVVEAANIAKIMLQSTFASMYELQWVLLLERTKGTMLNGYDVISQQLSGLLPPLPEGSALTNRSQNAGYENPGNLRETQVRACKRQVLLPDLHTRLAQMEDHDDLVAIFDKQTLLQSKIYGEYFLAELIGCKASTQDKNNRCISAEVNGRAAGFASFTTDVDLALLMNCFELSNFDFFIKPSYHDQIKATLLAQHSLTAMGKANDFALPPDNWRNTRGTGVQAALLTIPGTGLRGSVSKQAGFALERGCVALAS